MKPKILLGLALVLSGFSLATLTGCRGMGTQKFEAFAPLRAHELETSSHTVLDVICIGETRWADYNLQENLSMLAPMPKRWKLDLTLQVQRVVKGKFDDKTLQLHWLREPTGEQCALLGISPSWQIGFTNGTLLRIGFDGSSGKRFTNLKLAIRQ